MNEKPDKKAARWYAYGLGVVTITMAGSVANGIGDLPVAALFGAGFCAVVAIAFFQRWMRGVDGVRSRVILWGGTDQPYVDEPNILTWMARPIGEDCVRYRNSMLASGRANPPAA